MFEDIQKHRQAVRENIEKSLQIGFTESEDFEKAHQVGDIHPNGKWVWTQLPSGKFDWRVRKQSSAPSAPSAASSAQTTPKSSVAGAKTFEDVLAAYQKGGVNAVQTFDGKTYDLFEYEKQKKMALSVDESGRSFGAQLVKTNIKETQQKIDDTKRNHPGATATMAKLNQQMAKFNAQLKAIEDAEKELKEKLPEVKFTSSDFKKEKMEREEGDRKDALQLYWHVGPKTEYYDDDGKKEIATPEINEFYSDYSQKHLGGYEIRFDYAGPIGSFRTLNEAVSALNDWVNKKRVKNHPKPKWIYNRSKGDYQMNYEL